MISSIKYILILILTPVVLAGSLFPQTVAAVDCNSPSLSTKEALECGICQGSGQDCAKQTPQQSAESLEGTIAQIINILSIVVGVIAVFMIIFGGLRYITSGGAADKISMAKNTLLYAIIGLIIVALAQIIVKFVLTETSNPPNNTDSSESKQPEQACPESRGGVC